MKKKLIAILSLTMAISSACSMTTFAASKQTMLTDPSAYEAGNAKSDYVVSATGYDEATNTSTNDYILPESAKYTLTEKELSHLTDYELFLARNEIFARYGRMFNNEKLNEFFSTKSWYHPTIAADDFDASIMNATDTHNVTAILNYEQRRGSQYTPNSSNGASASLGSISNVVIDEFVDGINRTLGQSLTYETSTSKYNRHVDTTVTCISYEEVNGDADVTIRIGLNGEVYRANFLGMDYDTTLETVNTFCQTANIAGFDKDSFTALAADKNGTRKTTIGLYDFSYSDRNGFIVNYLNFN